MRFVRYRVAGRACSCGRGLGGARRSFSLWGLLLFFVLLWGLLAGSARAQPSRTTELFYLRFGQGTSTITSSAGIDEGISPDARYAPSAELGYRFSPALSLGLGYQLEAGDRGAESGPRQVLQLLTRYKAGAREWRVAPYVDLGINASTGPDQRRYGPSVGAGLDLTVDNRLSFFVESKLNLTVPATVPFFPAETADAYDAAQGLPLSTQRVTSIGAEFVLHEDPNAPTIRQLTGPTEVRVGESVTYSATLNATNATRPIEREWTFGTGDTQLGMTATHTFRRQGDHVVFFAARNQAGSDRASLTVTVQDTLRPARITSTQIATSSAFVGHELSFRGRAAGDRPLSYEWDFGDGTTTEGAKASHSYDEAGTYTVRFEAANEGGGEAQTFSLEVKDRPAYSRSGLYVVQIGAFDERENAEQRALRALFQGYAARVRTAAVEEGTLYRVWAGRFWTEEAARQALSQLRDEAPDAFVRKAPSEQ